MMRNNRHNLNNVPIDVRSIRIEEIHVHLGDILPPGVNYSSEGEENVDLKLVVHFSDPVGRPRRKVLTFPGTMLL
jgi:hypothetical protein